MKTAIITGITGQDGSYLSEFLLDKDYRVIGIKRRTSTDTTSNISHILSHPNFTLIEGDVTDAHSMSGIIGKYKPDEFYNLAAQSHVGTSFEQPTYTFLVNAVGPLNILEAIRIHSPNTRFYQACHDIETKILTPNGIKKYTELSIGDLVYTLNENTMAIELKPIKQVLEYEYNGKMINIQSRRISQCVTPNHQVILTDDNNITKKYRADSLLDLLPYIALSHYSMPVGVSLDYISPKIILDKPTDTINHKNLIDFIEPNLYAVLVGLYIGDGYIKKVAINKSSMSRKDRQNDRRKDGTLNNTIATYTKTSKFSNRIEFAIPKNDKARNLICEVLTKANLEFGYDNSIVWCSCFGLAKKLIEDCGQYFDKKRVPEYFYLYNKEFLHNLLYGLLYSDGDAKRQYTTSNECLAMDIIRLIFILGYYPSLQIREDYIPRFSKKLNRYITQTRPSYVIGIGYSGKNKLYKSHIKKIPYDNKVWCLEIEDNHNFLIIRDGKIAFSGNSTSELLGDNYNTKTINTYDERGNYVGSYTEKIQDETTPLTANSPYGAAKLAAHNLVHVYRDGYGLFACAGILHNHESERRGENFVTRKITKWIAGFEDWVDSGLAEELYPQLRLGNIKAVRDWGYAKDYVEAMWLMLQNPGPRDYMIATGEGHTVEDFVCEAFKCIGINHWEKYVTIDPDLYRPCEVPYLRGCADKARKELGWEPKTTFSQLVQKMVQHDLEAQSETKVLPQENI